MGETPDLLLLAEASPRPVKIRTHTDLAEYLEICSSQTPLMEGHLCKDISKPKIFDKFRRRYFILYRGILLYYNYKSQYEMDKRKGLVSCCTMCILAIAAEILTTLGMQRLPSPVV